jgi:phospholipid-translocating P-type ATPase (flippase)
LKIKRARHETLDINSEARASEFRAVITCEQPNNRLYSFEGSMTFENERISLDIENVLLRGSTLRNTDWVIGVVLFTGHETKLMKNANKTPHKASQVENMTNRLIFIVLTVQILLCLICSIGLMVFTSYVGVVMWYLPINLVNPGGATPNGIAFMGFKGFWTFLILFNNLIPISLYVSLEVAKFIQGHIISKDLKMYHQESDTPAVVRTSSLNEELGQIQFIFSDKTGTLTCNKMDFLKFAVNGTSYGTGTTEISRSAAKREGRVLIDDRPSNYVPDPHFNFYDERINNFKWMEQPNAQDIRRLLVLLAICHTVIPERDPKNPKGIIYQASSPDEAALVKAARHLGVEFISRTTEEITIRVRGQEECYQILNILEFTSARKRQSIICRTPTGKLMLMTKGADSVVYPLLKPNQQYGEQTLKILENFGNDGLRTLVLAQTELNESFYEEWNKEFQEAKLAFVDRTEKIERVSDKIEKGLELIGVTAIEDKLQDGVPNTIFELGNAGIKIWVLTGDKQETAINIGFACDLLNSQMGILLIEGDNKSEVYASLKKSYDLALEAIDRHATIGLVVNGDRLHIIFEDEELKQLFLKLGMLCRSVVCCRVSPKQKSDIVLLVKENLVAVTLAIGDGANDVSMIQAAHVGVGISGEEGLQAANAADYSIGQFRFLKRLLLVHGRWSYRRISKLILYCFYKNIVLYLTQFWFVLFNGFSGTSVHDRWTIGMYNLIFTACPIMVLAVIDRDIDADVAENYPELYEQGHKHTFFNARVFIGWMINSMFHSCVCFFIPLICMTSMYFNDGNNFDMYSLGITIYSCVLFTVTIKVALETSSFTALHVIFFVVSVLSWFVFVFIYGSLFYAAADGSIFARGRYVFPLPEFYGILQEWRVFLTWRFWFTLTITVSFALLRDYFYKAYVRNSAKNLYYHVQASAKKKPREEIMKYFPLEEGMPKELKMRRKLPVQVGDVKQLFSNLKLRTYRGFAFSQTEEQNKLLEDRLGKKN